VGKLLNKQRRPVQFENLQISTNAACGRIEAALRDRKSAGGAGSSKGAWQWEMG